MATFQVSKKNKEKNKNVKKIVGWTLLACSTFIFLFSATRFLPFLKHFFLGLFGVSVYPFCIVGLVISLALLNNRRYVMPKRYATFLILSLFFVLAIIQMLIIGNGNGLSYGEFVGLNYSKQITACGMVLGFLPSTLMYLTGELVTYIILSLGLLISVAFFVEAMLSMRKTKEAERPIKLQIKDNKKEDNISREEKVFTNPNPVTAKQEINVVLNGNLEEEEKKEKSARELLGLVGGNKQPIIESYQPKEMNLPEDEGSLPKGMSVREYLLSPPKVDLEKFKRNQEKFKKTASVISQTTVMASKEDIRANLEELKQDEHIIPEVEDQPQSNLTEISPEDITDEAEDIIRNVVEQEKLEREETRSFEEKEEQNEDLNAFIDFDEIDSSSIYDAPAQEQQEIKPRNDFARDFNRDRDRMPSREEGLSRRDNFSREEGQRVAFRDRHGDEMDRRRHFVTDAQASTQEEKKEIIKPYKYTRPSLDLITTASDDPATFNADMTQKSVALENALESFGIPAKVQSVVIGPTVTRYEIEMPEGISVKRILSLDADIAYALSANGQIRIEAPIPGRSIVGIEVPNKKVAMVSIKDVLSAKEFTLSPSPLTFALGKDITGNVKVCNLQKMPHLLVAGTTGSGKSVCLNSIITSIIYKSSPDEVKFIMIDPKQVELSMYEGLPHMIVPRVITDPTKAVNALGWAVDEMERRFRLISDEKVRNIDEYNKCEKVLNNKVKKMPYIVIIFDEFADFMAVAKNEIEDKIRRLAGKARAAGIHLILATQRPSTDVVTGTLKANLPARIAFRVAGRVDGEVILGTTGAEKLLGYGDMLYKPADTAPQRIQGCFIATAETKAIVEFVTANNEETVDEEAMNAINGTGKNNNGGNGGEGNNGTDPLLAQALKICIDNGVASTTMVQRKLSIGYPRAARIIDQMEERGYIASADGAKQRAVYVSIDEFYAIFGDIYD